MKISIYLLLLSLLIFSTQGFGQKIRTLFYDEILYGKVKQTIGTEFMPGAGIIELKDTTWYDDKGNTLENHRKTSRGTMFKEKYNITNDASGKRIEIIGNENDQNLTARFDSKGNMVEYDSRFKTGGINFSAFYEYDERNNLLTYRQLDKNNKLKLRKAYKYDKDDRLIEEDAWGDNNQFYYHKEFQYPAIDKAGNWTKRTSRKKLPGSSYLVDSYVIERQIIYYQ